MKRNFPKEIVNDAMDGDDSVLILIDQGKWVSDGKYEHQEVVFKSKDDGKTYMFRPWRTGSYYSDYSYWDDVKDEAEMWEVEKATKTVEYWKTVV